MQILLRASPKMKNSSNVAFLILTLFINQVCAATYSGVEPMGEYSINDLIGVQVQDLDSDQSKEIVAYTGSMIYVFNSSASLRWTYGIDNLKAIYVSDVDNDGKKEILAVSGETVNNMEWGNLLILDMNGKILHDYDKKSGESYPHILFYSIVSVDLNANGYGEIIGASSSGVHAIKDSYDKILWTARTEDRIKEVVINSIDDKNKRILALSDMNLYSFSLKGEITSKYNSSIGIKKIALLELGLSKNRYIAIVRSDDQITILDSDFNVRYEANIVSGILELAAYDINDDGLNEIVLSTKNGIYMLSSKYIITNKYVTDEPVSGVYYVDWEGDGQKELVFASGEYIYAVSTTGELKEKTGVGYKIVDLISEDMRKDDKINFIAHSNKKLSIYNKKKETQTESDARESYISAVGFLEMSKYDEAERSAQDALRRYSETGDTANVNACQTLIGKISSEKKKALLDAAEKDFVEAEKYFREGDYASAKRYADKSSRAYMELGDSNGIASCSVLSDEIYKASITKETKPQNIGEIIDSAKNLNIFPIFSVFLLLAIVLMLALLIGKKNEKK
jgi:hypothetical protein